MGGCYCSGKRYKNPDEDMRGEGIISPYAQEAKEEQVFFEDEEALRAALSLQKDLHKFIHVLDHKKKLWEKHPFLEVVELR